MQVQHDLGVAAVREECAAAFLELPRGHGAQGAKGIKSSMDKFLMALKLRIPVHFEDFCLYSCRIPKTFLEDVFMKLVFPVNYVKFEKLFT